MEHRLSALKPPVTFIYGENDWMDPEAAARICKTLEAQQGSLQTAASIPHRNRVLFIEDTGHFAFLEQPDVFNNLLLEVIQHCLAGDDRVANAERVHEGVHHKGHTNESNDGVNLDAIEAAFTDV
jgi:hypothetical protein